MTNLPTIAAELLRLQAKATGRPWVSGHQAERGQRATVCWCEDWFVAADTPNYDFHGLAESDAAFIVAACNAAPALAQGYVEATQRIREMELIVTSAQENLDRLLKERPALEPKL